MTKQSKKKNGVIAETYHDLQALGSLEKASFIYKTKNLSEWALVKAILQGTEIGIQNLNDLLDRVIKDLNSNRIGNAAIKLAWFKDLNYLIIKLTDIIQVVVNEDLEKDKKRAFMISSNTKLEYLLKKTDIAIKKYISKNNIKLEPFFETGELNGEFYKFLHDYRIISYEIIVWNKSLLHFSIPSDASYENFIGLELITKAVNEPRVKDDTFFTQFRGLHQIPEILTAVVNNYLKQAIEDLKKSKLEQTHKHLRIVNILYEITLASLKPIIDNLSQNEYHKFRKYLGQTSGSHSVNLHFQLFRDLYPAIAQEYVSLYFKNKKNYKLNIKKDYRVKLIENELFKLRDLIRQWRVFHLHLPKNNLGKNKTKSLIGAKEAVSAAEKMQSTANSRDPLNALTGVYQNYDESKNTPLLTYLMSKHSFNKELDMVLGNITKKRFPDVQNRVGHFKTQVVAKTTKK